MALTQRQALEICEAHEILELLDEPEETRLLSIHNPSLLDAYKSLAQLAMGIKY